MLQLYMGLLWPQKSALWMFLIVLRQCKQHLIPTGNHCRFSRDAYCIMGRITYIQRGYSVDSVKKCHPLLINSYLLVLLLGSIMLSVKRELVLSPLNIILSLIIYRAHHILLVSRTVLTNSAPNSQWRT